MKQKMMCLLLLLLCCLPFYSSTVHNIDISIIPKNTQECKKANVVELKDTLQVQEVISWVENFYKTYTTNILSSQYTDDLIKKQYLTKRLIEKLERVMVSTGADPIIRAQDFNETAFETLNVKSLGDNWYMVNYRWYENDDRSNTCIPLKVILVDGDYMIDYIVPEWNGSQFGDKLLCEDMSQHPVDNSSPQSMLETFYAAYTFMYNSMPEGLFPQLEALRKAHLTPNALNQFNEAAINMYELDKVTNYDVLIDGFDFDCLWIPSITYVPLNESTFNVSYVKCETLITTVTIGIIEIDGEYKINSIRLGN